MKKITVLLFLIVLVLNIFGQKNQLEQDVVDEGKKLYATEMASRYGPDVLLEKYPERMDSIGDYFSYIEKNVAKCVFISKGENPKVIATILFDSPFDTKTASIDKTRLSNRSWHESCQNSQASLNVSVFSRTPEWRHRRRRAVRGSAAARTGSSRASRAFSLR